MAARLLALLLVVAGCSPRAPVRISTAVQGLAAGAGALVVLHVLADGEGTSIRGAAAELGGRLYWLAGERGPAATTGCASTANWNTVEHKAHCPGSLVSIALDGADFRVDHGFDWLDDVGQNSDGYHPYGSPAAAGDCIVGVTQVGGRPVGAGVEATAARGVGTLWRYCPAAGDFAVLHNFFAVPRALDGEYPMGTPAALPDGRVCGTAKGGGTANMGTVWCWSPTAFVYASLTAAAGVPYGGATYSPGDGLLHLITNEGGANGVGAYVTVDPTTMAIAVIGSFPAFVMPGHANDNTPIQAPTLLSDGSLVVAREFGGARGSGLVARLSPAGITVLKEMQDVAIEAVPRFANATGGMPNGGLAELPSGLIVGAATYGGEHGAGGIYTLGATVRLVHSFDPGGPSYPYGGLTTASTGAVYGSTFNGSVLFKLDLPRESCAP